MSGTVFGNQKTVIRSGYGYYDQRVSEPVALQTEAGGFAVSEAQRAEISVHTANPFTNICQIPHFHSRPIRWYLRSLDFNGNNGCAISERKRRSAFGLFFFPSGFRPPYAQTMETFIQRDLGKGWFCWKGILEARDG